MPTDPAIIQALFRSAAYLDLETLGLQPGAPIHQVSAYDASKRQAIEYIPNPFKLVETGALSQDPLRAIMKGSVRFPDWQTATREYLDPSSPSASAWVSQKIEEKVGGEYLYPHLKGQIPKPTRTASVGKESIGVRTITGMDPGMVYREIFKNNIGANQVLWIANSSFEAAKLGDVGKVFGVTEDLRGLFTYAPATSDRLLYVNDPGVLAARAQAYASGDWRGVWEAIKGIDLSKKGIKTLDVLDVVRAAQSHGQELSNRLKLGINLGDTSTGVGLDVQSRIMGMGNEFHRASEDNLLSALVGEQSATHISHMEGLLDRANMATGSALRVKNAGEADALNWLWKMHSLKTQSSQTYMRNNVIARAMKEIEETGSTVFNTGFENTYIKQLHQGKMIDTAIGRPQRSVFTSMDQLLGFISTTKRGEGLDLLGLEREVRSSASIGGRLDTSILGKMIESGASGEMSPLLNHISSQVNRFKVGDILGASPVSQMTSKAASKMGGRLGLILGGIGALTIGTGILSGVMTPISSTDDSYNSIEGMSEGTYGAWLRQGSTDFGSGYRKGIGTVLAASVIGGLFSFNMSLNQGIHIQTTKSVGTMTANQVQQLGKSDIIFAAEEFYKDQGRHYGGFSFKEAAERIGAKVIPVGPTSSLEDAIKIANGDIGRSRVFIAAHGNNGTIAKFTGSGEAIHDWVGASPGYLAKNLDKRFTIDLGTCNAGYLLNFNEADTDLVESNRTRLGSHEPLQIYSDLASADEISRVRAYSGTIGGTERVSGVATGFQSYFLDKVGMESFQHTPMASTNENMVYAPGLLGKSVTMREYTKTNIGTTLQNEIVSQYQDILQPTKMSQTSIRQSVDVDTGLKAFRSKTLGTGLMGAIGGFLTGLFKSVGDSLPKLNLSKKIKGLAQIPSVGIKKTLNAMNAGLNSAGVTGRAVLGSVIKTGQNLAGFATSTGRSIGSALSSGVGRMSQFTNKARDSIGSNTREAYKSLKTASLNVRTSIGRNSNDLLESASSNNIQLPKISNRFNTLPFRSQGIPKQNIGIKRLIEQKAPRIRIPEAIERSVDARTYRTGFDAVLNRSAKVKPDIPKRLETTRFKAINLGSNASIGELPLPSQGANSSFASLNRFKKLQLPPRSDRSISIGKLISPKPKIKLGQHPSPIKELVEATSSIKETPGDSSPFKIQVGPGRRLETTSIKGNVPFSNASLGTVNSQLNPANSPFNPASSKITPSVAPTPPVTRASKIVSTQTPTIKTASETMKETVEAIKTAPESQKASKVIDEAVSNAPKPSSKSVSGMATHSPKGTNWKGFAIGAAAAGVIGIMGMAAFSGKGSESNTVEGMSSNSMASEMRERNTDFGSPYGGLWDSASLQLLNAGMQQTPTYVNNISIDQQIADFRDTQMQTPFQKRLIEQELQKQQLRSMDSLYFLNPASTTPLASANYGLNTSSTMKYGSDGTEALVKSKNFQVIDITRENWAVEDADTITLKQGLMGVLGGNASIRLAGIDSPEVEHTDEEIGALRYKQGQPHGSESRDILRQMLSEAKEIKLVVDPMKDTYGRSLGVIIADGKNINLEMVRQGTAAALPFGERTDDMIDRNILLSHEQMAYENNKGMWSDEYWRTYKKSVNNRNRITFNTLSRIDKLAGNMNLAALENTMTLSQQPSYGELTAKSIPYLRQKLSTIGTQKSFSEHHVPVKYQNNQSHLDQLKIETSRHMSHYGSLLADNKMSVKGHQFGNVSAGVDSLERSSSIYHSRLPSIIDKYREKSSRKKLQGIMQRQANMDIMPSENVVRM